MSAELRRRLREADPELRIVPGRRRRQPGRSSTEDWDRAVGVVCSACGRESFRARGGMCLPCWERMKDEEVEVRDPRGLLSHWPSTILAQITHKSNSKH